MNSGGYLPSHEVNSCFNISLIISGPKRYFLSDKRSEILISLALAAWRLRQGSHCGLIFFMSRHKLSHKYVATFTPRESRRSHLRDINDIAVSTKVVQQNRTRQCQKGIMGNWCSWSLIEA